MLQFSVSSDAARLLAQVNQIKKERLPKAITAATNEIGAVINSLLKKDLETAFDNPTALTLKAIDYERATLTRPVVNIWIKRNAPKSSANQAKYLHAQMAGGPRRHKNFEVGLIKSGFMRADQYAMPGPAIPLDGNGNVPPGLVRRMLADIRRYQNDGEKPVRARRGARKTNYFFPAPRKGSEHLKPGIYWHAGAVLWPAFIFTRAPNYRVRFDFIGKAQRIYSRYSDQIITKHLKRVLSGEM